MVEYVLLLAFLVILIGTCFEIGVKLAGILWNVAIIIFLKIKIKAHANKAE